jgi:lipopolysaccharide transport system permease protein
MGVISKVYFPRLIMPISATISGLVDFLMSFVVLLGMMIFYGFFPSWKIVFLPLFLLLAGCAGLGIGLWTATLAVKFRDLAIVAGNGIRVAMYLTPVAYSATLIEEHLPQWVWLYKLNPMYWVIEGFRWCLLGTDRPPELYMLIPVALTALVLITGAFVFTRTERTIVDLL